MTDSVAILAVLDQLRLAQFLADTTHAEWAADSTAMERVMAPDYVRYGFDGRVAREDGFWSDIRTRRYNVGVLRIDYDEINVDIFGDVATSFYRSRYVWRDGTHRTFRTTRTLQRRDGTWRIIAGLGFPLQE